MKAGTHVKLADGREGTVVYNGLDGVGIKWGIHDITLEDIFGNGGLFNEDAPEGYDWTPDAMLREPYKYADIECVGDDFEVIYSPA